VNTSFTDKMFYLSGRYPSSTRVSGVASVSRGNQNRGPWFTVQRTDWNSREKPASTSRIAKVYQSELIRRATIRLK
jgi:hypothetical protein